ILENADHVVFLSEAYKKRVIENYIPSAKRESLEKKVSIIPNGIDNFWFENLNKPKKKDTNSYIKLLQVGNIDKNKNVRTTVKVVEQLRAKGFNVELNLVGAVKDKNIMNEISKHN